MVVCLFTKEGKFSFVLNLGGGGKILEPQSLDLLSQVF